TRFSRDWSSDVCSSDLSVVCLMPALQFHGIGTQLPAEIWLAVPRGTRVPQLSAPPVRVVRVAPDVFDLGVEEHRVEGQTVRVYKIGRASCRERVETSMR